MLELLKKLTSITAPSGNEEPLRELISKEIAPYVDEMTIDDLGSLIAHKKGSGERVMFAAHMDEIGIIVTFICDNGLLKFSNLGGVSAPFALFQRVRFPNGTTGVVAFENKDADTLKNLKLSDLYIDIGARSREEAEQLVGIGDAACFCGEFSVNGDSVISKALDDRAGCCVLIETIRQMQDYSNDLYFVFTFGEELGLRGAKASAPAIAPDYAVALDVTRTGDVPGMLKMAVSVGSGPAVKIKDSSFLAHPYIKKLMVDICTENNIPYQLEVLEKGGTDSGAIHLTNGGVPSGCISIPTRYIHTPCELCSASDLENAVRLTLGLIEKGFHM